MISCRYCSHVFPKKSKSCIEVSLSRAVGRADGFRKVCNWRSGAAGTDANTGIGEGGIEVSRGGVWRLGLLIGVVFVLLDFWS